METDAQSARSTKSNVTNQSTASTRVKEILRIVNLIFTTKGRPIVKSISTDFADGTRFLELFNILFDEKMDLKLSKDGTLDMKTHNWNKINASICFNYLQQQFILIGSTMKALAAGKKGAASKAITCLLECT